MRTLLLLVFLLKIDSSWGWGQTGHRAVGEVAWNYLTLDTRIKIKNLVGDATLARVATWPDEIKSEPENYKYTFSWHYTDWPDDSATYNEEQNSGSLIKAIRDQVNTLKNPLAAQENKVFALKFIAHLIGDLHMPLHVGNGLDQGGNLCKVTFMGTPMNLHSVWDEGMIDFTKLSFTELARFAALNRSNDYINQLTKTDILDWALESKKLRLEIYPTLANGTPISCKKDAPTDNGEIPKLSYEYSYKFMPVVERRIFEAGVRLAHILNQSL